MTFIIAANLRTRDPEVIRVVQRNRQLRSEHRVKLLPVPGIPTRIYAEDNRVGTVGFTFDGGEVYASLPFTELLEGCVPWFDLETYSWRPTTANAYHRALGNSLGTAV